MVLKRLVREQREYRFNRCKHRCSIRTLMKVNNPKLTRQAFERTHTLDEINKAKVRRTRSWQPTIRDHFSLTIYKNLVSQMIFSSWKLHSLRYKCWYFLINKLWKSKIKMNITIKYFQLIVLDIAMWKIEDCWLK